MVWGVSIHASIHSTSYRLASKPLFQKRPETERPLSTAPVAAAEADAEGARAAATMGLFMWGGNGGWWVRRVKILLLWVGGERGWTRGRHVGRTSLAQPGETGEKERARRERQCRGLWRRGVRVGVGGWVGCGVEVCVAAARPLHDDVSCSIPHPPNQSSPFLFLAQGLWAPHGLLEAHCSCMRIPRGRGSQPDQALSGFPNRT